MAWKTKYGDDLEVGDIVAIRGKIEEQTAHITQSDQFQIGELLNHINEIHHRSITVSQIRHLRQTHLLRPKDHSNGDRKVYWFTRRDLQDVLVLLTLTDTHHMPLSKAAGLLWEEECLQNQAKSHIHRRDSVAMPHNHMRRAQYHLRGRLLEIVLTWLFGERSPYNAVALLRQNLQLHRTNTNLDGQIVADNVDWSTLNTALDPRAGDLVISVSQEGEVLHAKKGIEWQEFRHYRWYHLRLSGQRPAADYTLIAGLPQALVEPLLAHSSLPETARILTPLLHLCFLSQQWGGTVQANTPLQAMANMIPNIAESWQYCAILTPNRTEETLRFLTHSDHFPADLNTAAATLSTGKLLSGWTFQTGQDCVVQQSIGRDDPRIDHQHEERATAGIAVPTVVNNHINGVIYVGSRRKADNEMAFSPAQIRVLKLLGGIVGEFIERQTIAKKTRQTGLQILLEKPIQKESWKKLPAQLHQTLKELEPESGVYSHLDNLHIMAVQLNNYRKIQARSETVAEWVVDLLANTAGNFYRERFSVQPILFTHQPFEFVVYSNKLQLDDETEWQLRNDLQEQLNTLILPFDQGLKPIKVKSLVWSLSFRYEALCGKVAKNSEQTEAANKLQQEVEDALANLPLIHQAHIHEAHGSYKLAYELYLRAHNRSPRNTYLMRHLAKMRTRLGDYNGAIGWWTKVIHREKHSRFYVHRAEVFALSQDYSAAMENYKKAAHLDPADARPYLGWGQVLMAAGHFEEALKKFGQARDLDEENKVLYTVREAQAWAGLNDYPKAIEACDRALIWDKDNPEANYLLLEYQARRTHVTTEMLELSMDV